MGKLSRRLVGVLAAALLVVACSRKPDATADDDNAAETPKKRAKAKPKPSPSAEALAAAKAIVEGDNLAAAHEALDDIVSSYAGTPEAKEAAAELDKVKAREQAAAKTAIDALDKVQPHADVALAGGMKLHVSDVSVVRHWVVGSFGSGSLSQDADKDSAFATLAFDVTVKDKDPKLPCVLAYLREKGGALLTHATVLTPQFARWDSYGSYLGNNADIGNDFAKSDTVRFVGGGQIELTELSTKSLWIVVAHALTLARHESRFDSPPVTYEGKCVSSTTLTPKELASDFDVIEVRAPRAY
ncbi:MAG: hypothetical protein ACHREM_04280 [Polyangiales bacterium]